MIEKIFNDVVMINSDLHFDSRGSFLESYNKDYFSSLGVEIDFIQDNISYSLLKNTIRGLHYQTNKFEQSKFVYVISGSIFDVFIDARPNSDSFGMFSSVILDSPEKGILIPKGYLHGFCTLTDNTVVGYKVDNLYNKDSECGVIWDDTDLKIDWPLGNSKPVISDKDNDLLTWDEFKKEINNL